MNQYSDLVTITVWFVGRLYLGTRFHAAIDGTELKAWSHDGFEAAAKRVAQKLEWQIGGPTKVRVEPLCRDRVWFGLVEPKYQLTL